MLELKKFKVKEVVEAIEENGFEHLRGEWIDAYSGKITGGCVLAQGALNLKTIATEEFLPYDLAEIIGQSKEYNLVAQLNRFPNVSQRFRADSLECGSAIVELNDKVDEETDTYVLETYDEVVEMVRDILRPYMNRLVTLQVVDYGDWLAPKLTTV